MCGRFALHITSEELGSFFGLELHGFCEQHRYNIAPGQWIVVVRPESRSTIACR